MRYNADSCLVGILKKLTAIELSIHDGKLLTMLPEQVLRAFRLSAADLGVEYLGNHGGYSGAAIWRISERSNGQELCLRRWPHSSDQRTRLAQIHTLLQTAVANGFQQEILPVPIATLNGEFWTEHKGSVYELTRWLPGIADKPCVKTRIFFILNH